MGEKLVRFIDVSRPNIRGLNVICRLIIIIVIFTSQFAMTIQLFIVFYISIMGNLVFVTNLP